MPDGTKTIAWTNGALCELDPQEHISVKFYLKFKHFFIDENALTMSVNKMVTYVEAAMCSLMALAKELRLLTYRKTSSISPTKCQSLNVSCILVQLSSRNPLKPDVKLRMKM